MYVLVLSSHQNPYACLFYRIVPHATPTSPISFDYAKNTNKEFPHAGFSRLLLHFHLWAQIALLSTICNWIRGSIIFTAYEVTFQFKWKFFCVLIFRRVRKTAKSDLLASSYLSVRLFICPSAWNNSAATGRIF